MTYQQAFHTCCRDGLTTKTLGFQYQAASPGLDRDALAALARVMVGYVPGPSAPPTPSDADLARFPISLRYFQVSGVGAAVSQTVYVGREDRAAASGRFGNYFSHVFASPGGSELTGMPRPISLWRSPDWRTEAGPEDGAGVEALRGGAVEGLTADALLADPARRAWRIAAHDWLADAVNGRARIVVLDDDQHGWAWVATLTLPLPAAAAAALSFDTFTGEPERSGARICIADPDCDRATLARHVLTGGLRVIDLREPAPEPRGLLARAVAAGRAHACGAPADDRLTLDEFALVLALQRPDPMSLEPHDLDAAIGAITDWATAGEPHAGDLDAAAALIGDAIYVEDDLNDVPTERIKALWEAVAAMVDRQLTPTHVLAMRLALLKPEVAAGAPLPKVQGRDAPPELVGAGIELMSRDSASPVEQAAHLLLLADLRLVGVNAALDKRIGTRAARCLGEPGVCEWLQRQAPRSEYRMVLEQAVRGLCGDGLPDTRALDFLSDDTIGRIHDALSGSGDDFPITYARAVVRQRSSSEQPRETLEWALARAEAPAQADLLIDASYGDRIRPAELREILRALGASGRQPGRDRLEQGWKLLEEADLFAGDPAVSALAADLHAIDNSGSRRSVYVALYLEHKRAHTPAETWLEEVAKYQGQLSDVHLTTLLRRGVEGVTAGTVTAEDHERMIRAGVSRVGGPFIDAYWDEVSWALRDGVNAGLAAYISYLWLTEDLPDSLYYEIRDVRLPKALGPWAEEARDEIGIRLARAYGPDWGPWWQEWREDHPASGALGRGIRKLRARRPHG